MGRERGGGGGEPGSDSPAKEEMCKARPKSTKDIHFRRHSLQEIFGFIEYRNKTKTFTDKVIMHLEWFLGLKHIV